MTDSRIFISHSSHDTDTAKAILSFLESKSQPCWIAPRDIHPGADWAESILDGIDAASGMILVVSPVINDSPHIRREVERAVSNKIPIYPIIIEEFQYAKWIQYYISAHQWIDASNCKLEQVLQQLIIILEPNNHNSAILQLDEINESAEVSKPEPSEEKAESISQADNNKADTSEDKYKRRYKLVRNSLIWFFIGCAVFVLLYMLPIRNLDDIFDFMDGMLLPLIVYGLAYGLTGFVLSFLGDRSYRKRFIFSSICIYLFMALPAILMHGIRGWLIDGVEFTFMLSPFVLVIGLILAGLLTLLEKWMRH